MGKGDRKTRRGKIYNNSYGKVRPHRSPRATLAAKRKAGKSGSGKAS